MASLIKETEMELNIKWVEIREVNALRGKFYFVANIFREGGVKDFCIAFKTPESWKIHEKLLVPFEVTHVGLIDRITHTISRPTHAIGDRVIISVLVEEYKEGSIGEIVGKYDKMSTWCIRMEDNFVILLEQRWFKRYYPGET